MPDLPDLDPNLVTLHTSYGKHAPHTNIAPRISICSCGLWLYHHSDGFQSARGVITYIDPGTISQYKPSILAHINHITHDKATAYMNAYPPLYHKDHIRGMDVLMAYILNIR